MPDITSVDISKAIVAELQAGMAAGTFGATRFVVERAYMVEYELKAIKDMIVTVVPESLEISTFVRTRDVETNRIDIAVRKRLGAGVDKIAEIDEVDGLIEVVRSLTRHFRRLQLTGLDVTIKSVSNQPIYVPQHLREWKQFTSVIRMAYEVHQ